MDDRKLDAYNFDLPGELIAQRPCSPKDHSRLLVYHQDTGAVEHRRFYELPEILESDDLIIFNQTKVFPCRLLGQKPSGGKVEVFLLSTVSEAGSYPALIKCSGKKKVGDRYVFKNGVEACLTKIEQGEYAGFHLEFNAPLEEILSEQGLVPIPPYIRDGLSDDQDLTDYQTYYSKVTGSVAAPTAGLHFTENVFDDLKQKSIHKAYVTLHVGMGTFAPVKSEDILDHEMHSESYMIDQENFDHINSVPVHKRIAVGTTSLRTLASLSDAAGTLGGTPGRWGQTDIFLYPGKDVYGAGGLITNFHLPKSSLIMLVAAIIGREKALELYDIAIKEQYRFYSYGDAMCILPKRQQ